MLIYAYLEMSLSHMLVFAILTNLVEAVPVLLNTPTNVETFKGEKVQFTCVVKTFDFYDLFWLVQDPSSTSRIFSINALQNAPINITPFSLKEHGDYEVWYYEGGNHNISLFLRISNVTKDDANFRYTCAFSATTDSGNTLFIEWLNIILYNLNAPKDDPNCSVISSPTELSIVMQCSLMEGNPRPILVWYLNEMALTGNISGTNTFTYQAQREGNGQEFVCLAFSPALSKPLNCSLIPYSVFPMVSVTPMTYELSAETEIDKLRFICTNTGSHTNNTEFKWFLRDAISEITLYNSSFFKITQSGNESTLFLNDLSSISGDTAVICEIRIPSLSSANGSALISFVEINSPNDLNIVNHTVTDPVTDAVTDAAVTESHSNFPVFNIILYGAVGAGVAFLVLMIAVVVYCLRRKQSSKESEEFETNLTRDISSTQSNRNHEIQTYEKEANHDDIKLREGHLGSQDMPMYGLPNKSVKDGNHPSSEIPVYALPDKSRRSVSKEIESDIPIYALSNKVKRGRQSGHSNSSSSYSANHHAMQAYDDVHVPPSQYEVLPIGTNNDDANLAYSQVNLQTENVAPQERNTEGLTYADLDIPSSNANPSDMTGEDYVCPQTSTLYSEVRI